MSINNTLWLPPLSPQKQKPVNKQRLKQNILRWLRNFIKGAVKWVGFSDKTLLDLLSIIAIPVVIAVATMQFSAQQSEASTRIAQDQQQEAALQTYLDHISDLLLNNKLHESRSGDEVRNVARARTLTVLPQLNGTRKREVLQFLREASLIETTNETPIIDLAGANLVGANLRSAELSGANLMDANLVGADLRSANLVGANLTGADLAGANLVGADLADAYLVGAHLMDVNLVGADLTGADLTGANLTGADLRSAYLRHAYLTGADLRDTLHVTPEQLGGAMSLRGTFMPDGEKHT